MWGTGAGHCDWLVLRRHRVFLAERASLPSGREFGRVPAAGLHGPCLHWGYLDV